MDKNSTLNKRLKRLSTAAGAVLASAAGADAQVVYTDVNPDSVLTGSTSDSYSIDIDNDGNVDFFFQMGSGSVSGTTAGGIMYTVDYRYGAFNGSLNGWMGSTTTGGDTLPSALNSGASINSAQSFYTGTGLAGLVQSTYAAGYGSFGPYTSGNFPGAGDKYLGVYFDISGSTHYGWIRLNHSADGDTLLVKDYAYESTAGVGISAGDMGTPTGITEEFEQDVEIKNYNNRLKVSIYDESFGEGLLSIKNTAGQTVKEELVNEKITEYSLNDLSTGIYVVNLRIDDHYATKKIFVR